MNDFSYAHDPFVRVHRSTSLTVAGGTNVDVVFDVAVVNTNGSWNFTTSKYVCSKAGRYLLVCNFGLYAVNRSRGVFFSQSPSGERFGLAVEVFPDSFSPSLGSLVTFLNVGDTVGLGFACYFGEITIGENTGGNPYSSTFSVLYLA